MNGDSVITLSSTSIHHPHVRNHGWGFLLLKLERGEGGAQPQPWGQPASTAAPGYGGARPACSGRAGWPARTHCTEQGGGYCCLLAAACQRARAGVLRGCGVGRRVGDVVVHDRSGWNEG